MAELQDNSESQDSKNEEKLVFVTRQDLSFGYQISQTAHVVSAFEDKYPEIYQRWKRDSNSLICLAVKDQDALRKLKMTLTKKGVKYAEFFEPDVKQVTALAVEPSEMTRKVTKYIPLAGKVAGNIDKHALTKEMVVDAMKNTYQFETQNVLQHGESVYNYFCEIEKSLRYGYATGDNIKIPEHFFTHAVQLLDNLYPPAQLKEYMVLHDCGKPFCRTVDEEGKQHFPDHAEKSYEIYMQLWGNPEVGQLIRDDMDIHLLKDEGVAEFMKKPVQQICTHLLVGLAELLSNAQMFGGLEATSTKIKMKALNQRSKKILNLLFVDQEKVA